MLDASKSAVVNRWEQRNCRGANANVFFIPKDLSKRSARSRMVFQLSTAQTVIFKSSNKLLYSLELKLSKGNFKMRYWRADVVKVCFEKSGLKKI